MLIAGRKLVPLILHYTAHTGSRELFRLAVYAIALGVAYGASALFGVSVAVGAFFAGMVLAESPLSQRATEEALPLRDAFAVLFFVSVGMLFNPHVLVERPWAVLATLAVIVGGNGLAAFGARACSGNPRRPPGRLRPAWPRSPSSHSSWPASASGWASCRPRGAISSSPARSSLS